MIMSGHVQSARETENKCAHKLMKGSSGDKQEMGTELWRRVDKVFVVEERVQALQLMLVCLLFVNVMDRLVLVLP